MLIFFSRASKFKIQVELFQEPEGGRGSMKACSILENDKLDLENRITCWSIGSTVATFMEGGVYIL